MLFRKVLLCWCALLAVGISGQSVKFRSSSDECLLESVKEKIKYCLNRELIVNLATFKCFKVNSKGDCNEGERLVVKKESECKATKCVENKYRDGKPCPEGLLAYNGLCLLSGSKTACKDTGLGKRLHADLYGNVTCRCAVDLGYVDVNGTCYHSYTRGPCKAGEQIVRDCQGWQCLKHTCAQGWMQWTDADAVDRCYPVENPDTTCEDTYVLLAKSENNTVTVRDDQNVEDLLIVRCVSADVRSSVFDNCAAKASNGKCLSRRKPPTVNVENKETLKLLLSKLLLNNGSH